MATVRVQAAVQSGKVLLRLRNAMDHMVVITRVSLATPDAGDASPLITPFSVKLNPGEIKAIDVTEQVFEIVKPLSVMNEVKKRLQVQLFLDPQPPEQPILTECTLTVGRGQVIDVHC